jgi:hypothetical protein
MSIYEDDIPKSTRGAISAKLREIRAEVQHSKDSYDLPADTMSNGRRLSTKLSILAIDLTECRPEYLRGHGRSRTRSADRSMKECQDWKPSYGEVNTLLGAAERPNRREKVQLEIS